MTFSVLLSEWRLVSPLLLADLLIKSVDSVFVFQEAVEGDSSAAAAYDAIVVEQWTIIDVSSNTHALFCKLLLKYFHYCNYLHKRTKKHSIRQNRERKKKHSGSAARTAQKKKKEALERPVWVTVMGPAPHRVLAMLVEIRYCASSPLILLKLVSLGFIWARCVWGARLC